MAKTTPNITHSLNVPKRAPGKPTKTDRLQKLLRRARGATVNEIQMQLAWQPHTIRAAISRLRTAGLDIKLDRSGKTARYRAVQETSQ